MMSAKLLQSVLIMFLTIISLLLCDSKLGVDFHPVWRIRLGCTEVKVTAVIHRFPFWVHFSSVVPKVWLWIAASLSP